MFKRRFQRGLCWNQEEYARITITHVCFIALTLAGSLWRCLNTRPNGLVVKQLPRDQANVNAWKNMWSLYSLNFAIEHAQKRLLCLSECIILVLHKKTVLSLETSSEINFEFIKYVKKNVKCLPLTNQIGYIKYLVIFDLSRFSITFFLLPNQVDLSVHCSYHFSTSNVLRQRCNNTLIFLW